MPSDFTIDAVTSGPREWKTGQGGEFHAYRCVIRPNNGGEPIANVEVNYKPDSRPPAPGDELFGDVDREANYGPKFKKASRGGGGGGGGGGRAWTPEREASVIRQHSQHMAVLLLSSLGYEYPGHFDPTDESEQAVEYRRRVKRLTDYFDADVAAAVKKVKSQ